MTTNRPLTLRVDPQADPQRIAGWVSDGHGDEHYFEGWLGLFTLLEQTLWQPTCPTVARIARERDVVESTTSEENQWITAEA
jgi:hypothetical protein